jgi:hypothetical protein
MILYILRTVDCWPGRGSLLDPMAQRQFCPISNCQKPLETSVFDLDKLTAQPAKPPATPDFHTYSKLFICAFGATASWSVGHTGGSFGDLLSV